MFDRGTSRIRVQLLLNPTYPALSPSVSRAALPASRLGTHQNLGGYTAARDIPDHTTLCLAIKAWRQGEEGRNIWSYVGFFLWFCCWLGVFSTQVVVICAGALLSRKVPRYLSANGK